MAEIVRQRQRLGEILVEPQPAGERARNLRDFKRMGEPRAIVIAFVENENLSLMLKAAERRCMDDAVAVAAKRAAAFAGRLQMKAPTALARVAGVGSARF